MTTIRTDLEQLKRRIDDGYERIQAANAQGRDVRAWEAFWMDLLREYEEACEQLGVTPRKERANG